MLLNIKTHKKGSALYLVIAMLVILLPLALGLTTIIVGQLAITGEMGHSVVALYAADAAIEEVLLDWRTDPGVLEINPPCINPAAPCPVGDADYYVRVYEGENMPGGPDPDGNCDGSDLYYCVKAIGIYQDVNRSIEINF